MSRKNPRSAGLASEIGKREAFSCPQQEAYLNLVRTHEQLAGQFARLFKDQGISDPQYNALRILQGEGRPMQIYQIAERMVSPQTDISRLVDRLEAHQLIRRQRCDEDRRVVWIELTARGRSLLKKLAAPVRKLHQQQFRNLSRAEVDQLNELLFRARDPGN